MQYKIITPAHYKAGTAFEIKFEEGVFMPFDIIKGLDTLPPDNGNYEKHELKHWHVCPKTKSDVVGVQDISEFIPDMPVKEFVSLGAAINFALNWRQEWLQNQLLK